MTRPILRSLQNEACRSRNRQSLKTISSARVCFWAGIPTGLMLYQHIADKWRIHAGRRLLLGIIAFPICTLLGVLGVVPFLVVQTVRLFWKKSQPERTGP